MADYLKNDIGLEILTDTGWQTFDGIVRKGIMHTISVHTEESCVTLTPDHNIFLSTLDKIPADKLKVGDIICTLSGNQKIIAINENKLEKVYDIVNAGPNKRFFANNLLVSNCEFIIADETLINGSTLLQLNGIDPVHRMGQVRWYSKPQKGEIYVVGLDPSLGTGGDYAGIEIYSAKTSKQVGEWKHNLTPIPNQIKLLAEICDYIAEETGEPNNIYYSIENNAVGEGALISLAEYGESNISGMFMSENGKKRKGFATTNKSKLAACAKFKSLVESKRLKLYSKSLISELKTFVAREGSYAAKIGQTDDLVMGSLLVVRMMQQLSNYDADVEENFRDHDEEIEPLPFFAVITV